MQGEGARGANGEICHERIRTVLAYLVSWRNGIKGGYCSDIHVEAPIHCRGEHRTEASAGACVCMDSAGVGRTYRSEPASELQVARAGVGALSKFVVQHGLALLLAQQA